MKIFSNQTANKFISAFFIIWLSLALFGFGVRIAPTPQACPTCQGEYEERIYFLAANTGELHPLIIAPYLNEGTATLTAIYDEISQTRADIFQDYYSGVFASLHQKRNIVNIPSIKAVFCADCSQKLLTTIKEESITSFVFFLPQNNTFYPISDGLKMQIGDYTLSVNYDKQNDDIDIRYELKQQQAFHSAETPVQDYIYYLKAVEKCSDLNDSQAK